MATVRGRAETQGFLKQLPAELERKLLRGAARAAATIIAEEAKIRAPAEPTREALVVGRAREIDGRVVVKISVKPGWGRSLGIWAEYGTAPHFISVDDSQRQGMTIGRINEQHAAGTLVINGKPVGSTVRHPGAKPHPFLRVSLDLKRGEALAAAQGFINSRMIRLKRPAGGPGGSGA